MKLLQRYCQRNAYDSQLRGLAEGDRQWEEKRLLFEEVRVGDIFSWCVFAVSPRSFPALLNSGIAPLVVLVPQAHAIWEHGDTFVSQSRTSTLTLARQWRTNSKSSGYTAISRCPTSTWCGTHKI